MEVIMAGPERGVHGIVLMPGRIVVTGAAAVVPVVLDVEVETEEMCLTNVRIVYCDDVIMGIREFVNPPMRQCANSPISFACIIKRELLSR